MPSVSHFNPQFKSMYMVRSPKSIGGAVRATLGNAPYKIAIALACKASIVAWTILLHRWNATSVSRGSWNPASYLLLTSAPLPMLSLNWIITRWQCEISLNVKANRSHWSRSALDGVYPWYPLANHCRSGSQSIGIPSDEVHHPCRMPSGGLLPLSIFMGAARLHIIRQLFS